MDAEKISHVRCVFSCKNIVYVVGKSHLYDKRSSQKKIKSPLPSRKLGKMITLKRNGHT